MRILLCRCYCWLFITIIVLKTAWVLTPACLQQLNTNDCIITSHQMQRMYPLRVPCHHTCSLLWLCDFFLPHTSSPTLMNLLCESSCMLWSLWCALVPDQVLCYIDPNKNTSYKEEEKRKSTNVSMSRCFQQCYRQLILTHKNRLLYFQDFCFGVVFFFFEIDN